MLREHALYSGNLFDESLDSDDGARYADSVRDYWRTFVYPLSDADFAAVAVHWATRTNWPTPCARCWRTA